MIFKENLTEILDGIRPFLLPLNSYFLIRQTAIDKASSPTPPQSGSGSGKRLYQLQFLNITFAPKWLMR